MRPGTQCHQPVCQTRSATHAHSGPVSRTPTPQTSCLALLLCSQSLTGRGVRMRVYSTALETPWPTLEAGMTPIRGLARQAPLLRHPPRRSHTSWCGRSAGVRCACVMGRPAHAPPCPLPSWRWHVVWQSRRMPCAASRSRCDPNAGAPDPQPTCCPLALEESDLCAANPSRPHGATRSAPIPAPSVAARPPMMRRTIGPVPVARSRPPPSRRARSGCRRPGGGPTRRTHDARPDRPLVTPRRRVVDPLRGSPSRSYANPYGFTRPINDTDTLPASCGPPECIRPHQARNLIHSGSSM